MRPETGWRLGWAVLATALGLNLLTGNRLWTAYTLLGAAAFAGLRALDRREIWVIPPRPLVALAVLGALHFLGGSLAGVHRGFGVNGAYFVLPWWDNLAHFLGGALAWMLGDAAFRRWLNVPRRTGPTTLAAFGFAALAGVSIELYEFAGFWLFGTIDQGFYTNTMLDLYYDLLGAGAAAVLTHRWAEWLGAPASPATGASTFASPPGQRP